MTVKEDRFSQFLQSWIKDNIDIKVNIARAEFFYFSFLDYTLHWALYTSKNAKQFYLEFLQESFPNIDLTHYSFFTISFLHEVGHVVSDRDLGSDFLVTQFKEELKELKNNTKESHFRYFSQPGEVLATTWLVNYCYLNQNIVQELDIQIRSYLHDFYSEIADMQ